MSKLELSEGTEGMMKRKEKQCSVNPGVKERGSRDETTQPCIKPFLKEKSQNGVD